ncbi:MAG TPA: restriction endonuclease [Puia sp.]|uniref:restriction endonuclease n=1 Tax=Puia sp. TaxID=2045100 RepID=UPI002C41C37B|nr:restriction endonuclease [Puia sp.]HVU94515.1 restriction endonuclease [Puia sp.]
MEMIAWKDFEKRVLEYFSHRFPDCKIDRNVKIVGRLSKRKREIDILLSTTTFGSSVQLAIECKRWNSKIDVADVGGFLDKLKDVGISMGIMVSKLGYTSGAYNRAKSENNIQLQVLDFEHLPKFQNFWANPYRGKVGAIIYAPNGWLINTVLPSEMRNMALCTLNPFELTPEQAYNQRRFMYFNIDSVSEDLNLDKLLARQDSAVIEKSPKSRISYWDEETKSKNKLKFRQIDYLDRNYSEFTAAVELETFFAYCVELVPPDYNVSAPPISGHKN